MKSEYSKLQIELPFMYSKACLSKLFNFFYMPEHLEHN